MFWEDAKTGKASLGDGINSTTNNVDKNLENIKSKFIYRRYETCRANAR